MRRALLRSVRHRHGQLLILNIAASLLVGCTTLSGTGGLSDADRVFVEAALSWDQNKDGQVSCAEWQGYARDLFTAADADRDGKLSSVEFNRVHRDDKTFVIANFSYFDVNRDGMVTSAEFVDRPNAAFTHLDKNNDCALDAAELGAARSLNRARPASPPAGKDAGGGPGGGKGKGMPLR